LSSLNIVFGKKGYISSNWKKNFKSKDKTIFVGKIECDLSNKDSINKFLKKYKNTSISIFLLSAIVRKKEDNYLTYKKNINMVNNLILILKNYSVNFFFFLSSTDIFEKKNSRPINEKSKLNNSNFYAKYKIESERLIKKNFNRNKICILRIPGVFGGIKDNQSTINSIKKDIINRKFLLYNKSLRSYVFINDLIKFLNYILNNQNKLILNFCSDEKYHIYEIYFLIIKKIDKIEKKREFKKSFETINNIYFDNSYFTEKFPNFKFTKLNKSLNILLKK